MRGDSIKRIQLHVRLVPVRSLLSLSLSHIYTSFPLSFHLNEPVCMYVLDVNMQFRSSGGVYACVCVTDYTLVGVASLGLESCVKNSLVAEFISQQSAAVTVKYIGTSVSSMTLLHYYSKAAAYCKYFAGILFVFILSFSHTIQKHTRLYKHTLKGMYRLSQNFIQALFHTYKIINF